MSECQCSSDGNQSQEQIAEVVALNGEQKQESGWSESAKRALEKRDRAMRRLDAQYFITRDGGQTRVVPYRDAKGNPLPPTDFMTFKDFREWENERITVPYKEGDVEKFSRPPAGKWWLEHWAARKYHTVACYPEGAPEGVWNTWRGFAVDPKAGDWSLMQAHIRGVLADGNEAWAEYILKWAAWLVQNPERRSEVALTFCGKKGAGKGTFAQALRDMIGAEHSLHASDPDAFLGRFNGALRDKIFLFADEAFWAGDRKKEGKLKRQITEPTVEVEWKYKPGKEVRNMLHWVIASNEGWVIPATPDERRFAAFDVSDRYATNVASDEERRDYFGPLFAEMRNGGLAAMLHDLLGMDLGDWHPRDNIPRTPALRRQVERSEGAVDRAIRKILEDGQLPRTGYGKQLGPNVCPREKLAQFVGSKPGQESIVATEIKQKLESCGAEITRPRVYKRPWCWRMPPLAEMRQRFDPTAEWDGTPDWQQRDE